MNTLAPSSEPTDQLIRELIATGREPTRAEKRRILDRIAGAMFSRATVTVPGPARRLLAASRPLGSRALSIEYHRAKHTADGQWAASTTTHQYLGDLRRAARDHSAEFAVYRSGGRSMAAVRVQTEQAVPPARRGPRILPNLLVLYSADWGRILTGFQFPSLDVTDIPSDVRWYHR